MLQFRQAIAGSLHQCLYHFTDVRNLDSIQAHGLLSLQEQADRGIVPVAPGGNQWSRDADRFAGVNTYVHLCLANEHPAEYAARQDGRIGTSVFLHVSPDVLDLEGVSFTDAVSNRSRVHIRPIAEIDAHVDLDVLYGKTDWKDPAVQARLQAARKLEILVPRQIAASMLRKP
jgi:hypothetical protein